MSRRYSPNSTTHHRLALLCFLLVPALSPHPPLWEDLAVVKVLALPWLL